MEQVKTTGTHLIYKKKSGRYAVKDGSSKQWVNGDDKAAILLAEGLIKRPEPKAAPAESSSETASASEAEAESDRTNDTGS